MFYAKIHEQRVFEISQGDYISATADSFLIDRQAGELSRHTLKFYREFLRRYLLAFGERHNPGGVHGAYRTPRAFFHWLVKEELMATEWKNPMLKVKTPKVMLDPLEPISIADVHALVDTCQRGDYVGERDRATFQFLLETGATAREAYNMNIKETDLDTGAVMIRHGSTPFQPNPDFECERSGRGAWLCCSPINLRRKNLKQ